jgi:hypothetical protein
MADFFRGHGEFVLYRAQALPGVLPLFRIAFYDGPYMTQGNQFFMAEECIDSKVNPQEPFMGVNLLGFPHFNYQRAIQNVHGREQTHREAEQELLVQAVNFLVKEKLRQHTCFGKIYTPVNRTGLNLRELALDTLETLARKTSSAVTEPNSFGIVQSYTQEAVNHALITFSSFN